MCARYEGKLALVSGRDTERQIAECVAETSNMPELSNFRSSPYALFYVFVFTEVERRFVADDSFHTWRKKTGQGLKPVLLIRLNSTAG